MSYSDWARWCNESSSVALSSNLTRLNSVSFAAVAAYSLTVALAAFFLLRWSRLEKQSQDELWHGFKWFFAALAVGCAFGCARQAVFRQAMIYVFLEFNVGVDVAASANSAEYWHQFLTYWAPFVLLTSVEKIFIIYADFQILHYQLVKLFAEERVQAQRARLAAILNRTQLLLLIVNLAQLAVSCVCAYWNLSSARRHADSAAAFRSGDAATGKTLFKDAQYINTVADYFQGISLSLEAIITVSVVVAFTAFGLFFLRIVHASERLLAMVDLHVSDGNTYQKRVTQAAIGKGRRTRWRIQIVLCIVFCAYTNRAVFECMHAFAYVRVNRLSDCSLCADCQPVATIMATWFELNPEFSIISSVIAAPAALTLSLYGMMGQKEKELLFP